jgi:hypothetical protein
MKSLLAVFAFGFAAVAASAAAGLPVEPLMLSNQFMVTGEVVTRGEMAFTVMGPGAQLTTVYVNPDTSILKGAETIQLADIFVGDKVTAVVMRSADGKLQAVKVDVKTGYE